VCDISCAIGDVVSVAFRGGNSRLASLSTIGLTVLSKVRAAELINYKVVA
jgi:hypothetical protein